MIKLCTIFGTQVKLHWSLIIPFAICFQSVEALAMLVVIFGVVLLHEFGHIVANAQFGVKCQQVILCALGGIAVLDKEPPTPKAEFIGTLCGPLVNVALFALAIPLAPYVPKDIWTTFMFVNMFMFTFNMLPALPMDGGRLFRSTLWYFTNRKFATNVAVSLSVGICTFGLLYALYTYSLQLGLISLFIGGMAFHSLKEPEDEDTPTEVETEWTLDLLRTHTPEVRAVGGGGRTISPRVPSKSLGENGEVA